METCAESLARAALAETDYLLPYYIRFQRLAEEVDHAFDYSQNLKLPQLDTMRVEILLKSFEQQLNQVELTFPAHVWNNRKILPRPVVMSATDRKYSLYDNEILQSPHLRQRGWPPCDEVI